jgi:signal transduction histidine kinase
LSAANARIASETQARIATLEALRHADRLATVGRLASGVAHEMGTPLNVILARAHMVATGEGTRDELAEYGRIVVEQTERITRIIRQLLDFARGQKGRPGPAASAPEHTVDLRELAQSMCTMLAPLAAKRRISLSLAPGRTDIVTRGNRSLIEQAVANLVVNAIQASAEGSAVAIEVGAGKTAPPADIGGPEAMCVSLSVRDHGTGISAENLPRVFEPFFTTKEVGEGTGLGLSVAYGIVREHGGWISVASQPGRGSCFTISLPERAAATGVAVEPQRAMT